MKMRYIVVCRKVDGPEGDDHGHEEADPKENMEKAGAVALKDEKEQYGPDDDLLAYMKKHGNHFNDALATYASKQMTNANKTNHTWTVAEVQSAFGSLGYGLPSKATWGDAAYAANMYYADFSTVIKSDNDAIRMANAILHDADGYEGQLFVRYVADVMQTKREVPWKKML